MDSAKWVGKIRKIKRTLVQHVMKHRLAYALFAGLFVAMSGISILSLSESKKALSVSDSFYADGVDIGYGKLVDDLKAGKIRSYTENVVFEKGTTLTDVFDSSARAKRVIAYKFSYAKGRPRIYVASGIRQHSLDFKSDSEIGRLFFSLKMGTGLDVDSYVLFEMRDVVSSLLSGLLLIAIILGAQLLVTELLSGKDFSKKDMDIDLGFDDIVGYEDVKEQFRDVASYLRNRGHFKKNGLEAPRGILLTGDPGVGKTMFAKAFANEVKASLYFASGSDFAEMYVGVGAKRVRSLFESARLAAPSVVFIDEFDAIGNRSDMGMDSERTSVINQLLTELDGLNKRGEVFFIATTNHHEKIDKALLRPGRIDRIINVPLPDAETRKGIIRLNLGGYDLDESDLESLAVRTASYSGASIKSLMDNAKMTLAKTKGHEAKKITMAELSQAQESVLLGIRQSTVLKEENLRRVAYHELGHALTALVALHGHTVETVAVEPRGKALGFTMTLPMEEKPLHTKDELLAHICVLLGGRAAEEEFMGEVTNGAADDLQKANMIADNMATKFGMSDQYPLAVDFGKDDMKDGRSERSEILAEQYSRAKKILTERRVLMDSLAERLMSGKRLSGFELKEAFEDFESGKTKGS